MLIEFSFGKKDHNFDLLSCHLAQFSQFSVIIREITLVLLREGPPGLQNMSHVSFFDGGKNRFIAIYYPHNKNVSGATYIVILHFLLPVSKKHIRVAK